ncbi:MAG: phosphoglycerate kinase [Planctomycetaceae bacterium]|nr:phosphoglycerate kinase [Planctomycetaceae bacterium]
MGSFDTIRYVDDPKFAVEGKRVLVRVDFNVPMDNNGMITSDVRIREALSTIKLLQKRKAKVVLMSHLGRPTGVGQEPRFSLKTVAVRLAELLKSDVQMMSDCVGDYIKSRSIDLKSGEVMMLENVRFHVRETKHPDDFGKDLARNGDFFVNDAFGSCHRAHGSVTGVAKYLPHAAGLLIRKELEAFGPLLNNPPRPYVAILGGAKVSDKLGVIDAMLDRVNTLMIGGAMAYTFLKTADRPVGKSLVEDDQLKFAHNMFVKAAEEHISLMLPDDHVVAANMDDESAKVVDKIPDGMAAFDIGPKTITKYVKAISTAKAVMLAGPLGVFERERFANGTRAICQALADAHKRGALVVVGGGDSAAAVEKFGFVKNVTHISTGGGASLELLEGKELPGLVALAAPDPK